MAETGISADTTLEPRRFWWLKRTAILMLLLGGALVGLRYVALHVARRRLEAAIAAIRASGEPFEGIEILEKPVPAEEDAGPDVIAAWQLFVVPRQHLMAWNNISPALGY